jgi:rubredoxin
MHSRVEGTESGLGIGDWLAGARAKGEFRCSGCGYGITVHRELPTCPMCRGTEWERVPWRPYSRSLLRRNRDVSES